MAEPCVATYDVFISHRGPDTKRDFSIWLCKELQRRLRCKSFLDDRSLEVGDPALECIYAALTGAKVVIAVLSRGFFDSHCCMRELGEARRQGKIVLPIFFGISADDCTPAKIVPGMTTLWDRFEGGQKQWEEDMAWVAGRTGIRLAALDGFWDVCIDKGVQEVSKHLGRAVCSSNRRVPFQKNLNFVGRETELEGLRLHLSEHGQAYVYGLTGMGKTQMLLQYVHQHKNEYALIMWLDAGAAALGMEFLGLAGVLGVALASGNGAEPQRVSAEVHIEERNVEAVRSALEDLDVPCLLVFDNVEDGRGLRKLLPRDKGSCHVLASTQRRAELAGLLGNGVGIAMGPLTEERGLELLTGGVELSLKEAVIAGQLAQRLGYLTLALAVSAQMIRDNGTLPSELLAALNKPGEGIKLFLVQSPLMTEPEKTPNLLKLFDLTLNSAEGQAEGTKKELVRALLGVAGWMAGAPLPVELLTSAVGILEPAFLEVEAAEGIGLLVRNSLAERDLNGNVVLHGLVQEWALLKGSDEGRGPLKAMMLGLLKAGRIGDHLLHYNRASKLILEVGVGLGRNLLPILVDQICLQTAHQYVVLGRSSEASEILRGLDKLEGLPIQLRAKCLDYKGRVARMAASYGDAERYCREACQMLEGEPGTSQDEAQNELLLSCRISLAMVQGDMGKYEEAEALHRQILDARLRSHGTSSLVTASALSNLGTLLSMTEKLVEADMAHYQAFRIRRQQLGASHPITIDSMIDIAACLHSLGFEQGGELYLAEALKHRKLGPVEPCLTAAKTDQNLGYLLSCYGKLDEAVPFLRKALAVREDRFGALHPYTEWTQYLLGCLLIQLGELEEGGQRLFQVWESRLRHLPFCHPLSTSTWDKLHPSIIGTVKAQIVEDIFDKWHDKLYDSDNPDVDERGHPELDGGEERRATSQSWVRAFRAEIEASRAIQQDTANEVACSVQRDSTVSRELRRLQPRYRQHSDDYMALSTEELWGLLPSPAPA